MIGVSCGNMIKVGIWLLQAMVADDLTAKGLINKDRSAELPIMAVF